MVPLARKAAQLVSSPIITRKPQTSSITPAAPASVPRHLLSAQDPEHLLQPVAHEEQSDDDAENRVDPVGDVPGFGA